MAELVFTEITEADLSELTDVMTRAFDHDSQMHRGIEKGGPEGYDNGEFFRRWLFPYSESHGYAARLGGRIVGGIIVWVFEGSWRGHNRLGTIFVDPDYQDRGIGTQMWQFIEATYPDTLSWTLGTPAWAVKNHHFYEVKCGFRKVDEEAGPGEPWVSYIYRKEYR